MPRCGYAADNRGEWVALALASLSLREVYWRRVGRAWRHRSAKRVSAQARKARLPPLQAHCAQS
jgi:hypothetical protein